MTINEFQKRFKSFSFNIFAFLFLFVFRSNPLPVRLGKEKVNIESGLSEVVKDLAACVKTNKVFLSRHLR